MHAASRTPPANRTGRIAGETIRQSLAAAAKWFDCRARAGSRCARRAGLERSTLVRNAQLLKRRGWIGEGGSGRGRCFVLTDAGKAVLEQGLPCWQKAQQGVKEVLGEADAAALLRICGKLQDRKGERV